MTRQWLTDAINNSYLPVIRKLKDTPQGHKETSNLLQHMRNDWGQHHGLSTLKQQQGCMDQVRRAIKDALGEDHWSLGIIKFSREEYIELNNQKQKRVAQRNEAVQQINNPDEIVATAVRLLDSPEWADVAAGLAVLTGRRVSELLSTAQFEVKTRWSVVFTGAVKRGNEQGLQFEIPTLTTAERVCKALAKIRRELPQAREMNASAINRTYELAVVRSCQKHFDGLVPTREGRDSLYTHLFRAVYATIATFWYCPPSVNETEFKAAIQGHYQILDEQNPELRRSLTASRHYADYEISDRVVAQHNGKRKGIKLGQGGIEAIEMFKDAMVNAGKALSRGKKKTPSSVRMWREDKARLETIFDRMGLDGNGKQEDRMRSLLEWVEALWTAAENGEQELEGVAKSAVVPERVMPPEPEPTTDPLREDLKELISILKGLAPALVPVAPTSTQRATPAAIPDVQPISVKKERKNSTKPETIKRVNQAIDAIINYNNAPERLHDQKWAITINALKSWVSSAPTIMEVLDERKSEIDHHHHRHQIDPSKHNYRHRGKRKIEDVIIID